MGNLLENTRAMLNQWRADPGHTLRDLSRASGVEYEWLKRFARGAVDNPTVRPLQRLHDYLAEHTTRAA